jgi:hypothetical protein
VEPQRLPGSHLDGHPIEGRDDVGVDAPHVVHRQHLVVHARGDLEAAVLDRGVVDRHHARHVDVDEPVGRRVLVRRVAGASRQLVVDLLLVEHGGLAQQRPRRLDELAGGEERPQALVERDHVLAAAQLGAVVGELAVVHPAVAVVGPRRDLVDPRPERGHVLVVERPGEQPTGREEVVDIRLIHASDPTGSTDLTTRQMLS